MSKSTNAAAQPILHLVSGPSGNRGSDQLRRPGPDALSKRLAVALRDFGRVSAVLSTCAAALPAECAAGEPDVRGTLEVAERMLHEAIAGLESIHD